MRRELLPGDSLLRHPLRKSLRTSDHWCTGKDSNLRTSLGGTDLQSVGFNHSPTCAKPLGRCGRCAPADYHLQAHGTRASRRQRSYLSLQFRKTGKPRLAQETAKITARRKSTEWSALEKPVAPLTESAVRRKIRLLSFSGAGEGIRTPDPLITNQMLYRLSYASNSGDSARLRANESLGSLPNVRDN